MTLISVNGRCCRCNETSNSSRAEKLDPDKEALFIIQDSKEMALQLQNR